MPRVPCALVHLAPTLVALLAALPALGGCFGDADDGPPEPAFVDAPVGGGWAPCASTSAQQLAIGFTSEAVEDDAGLGEGLHRVDVRTFLWVYAVYEDTQRQDKVTRVNEVQTYREPTGDYVLCTRVDVATPLQVDGERRTYDVAVRFTATRDLPETRLRFVVNWIAGCGPCGPPPMGNETRAF